jgi:alkyl sulfatase BDS1-like metallo-beta-lactamase superfamily hydrolase
MKGRHWAAIGLIFCAFASEASGQARPSLEDRQDVAFAERGFVATRSDPLIKATDGRTVWNLNAFDFLDGPAPATADPLLWRHQGLIARHGLFRVADRIWQVRGFDVSNVTFIRGRTGWIVLDPLTTTETAAAALALVRERVADLPVTGLIYTHSHADHFGGARGVVAQADVDGGRVPVLAPEGFLEHAVAENVLAGAAMGRRAAYQFGGPLAPGPEGRIGVGIGQGVAAGTQSLIPPTREIARTGEEVTLDGVRMVFQLTPGTEAPAEMNVFFPDDAALCLAENANATLHNVLTPRGALVRDAKAWADGLHESERLFGARTDVLFTSHAWPRWGREAIGEHLRKHGDAYRYLHDQSVRLMNQGYTGPEIADRVRLPDALAREWYNRGFYGDPRFTARAVYQRYMGWYDANPASLDPLPPAEASRRYLEAMGGPARVRELAQAAAAKGDLRWATELLNRLVQAEPADAAARAALAELFRRQGFAAESALWRNMYLTGAQELTAGVRPSGGGQAAVADLIRNTPTPMLLDLMAVRLDGPRAAAEAPFSVDLSFPERRERRRVEVRNGVLVHAESEGAPADVTLVLPRVAFLGLVTGVADLRALQAAGQAKVEGDPAVLARFVALLDRPAGDFPIVTPRPGT